MFERNLGGQRATSCRLGLFLFLSLQTCSSRRLNIKLIQTSNYCQVIAELSSKNEEVIAQKLIFHFRVLNLSCFGIALRHKNVVKLSFYAIKFNVLPLLRLAIHYVFRKMAYMPHIRHFSVTS